MNKSKTRAKVKGKNSEHKWKKSDADFSMPKIAEASASLISPETAEINALAPDFIADAYYNDEKKQEG